MGLPPLALYVHIPWCEKKCPYCDFNSHVSHDIPEALYVQHLVSELIDAKSKIGNRPLSSIFFGGGTPSLFSSQAIADILNSAETHIGFTDDIEITLEANPSSAEAAKFEGYKAAGVNRLSIGVQSFSNNQLSRLGRIHNQADAVTARKAAATAGIDNINIDLMYGLPAQTLDQALEDLQQAIALAPQHISWYQLTIEQNTAFYNAPPPLPTEDHIIDIEVAGKALLQQAGYYQYEISAYAKNGAVCRHNVNYWQFGDYLGIGAGAHSKLSAVDGSIKRLANTRLPNDYLKRQDSKASSTQTLNNADTRFEFMMNALRLSEGVEVGLFETQTGLSSAMITPTIEKLVKRGHLTDPNKTGRIKCTTLGYQLLNSVIEQFLETT